MLLKTRADPGQKVLVAEVFEQIKLLEILLVYFFIDFEAKMHRKLFYESIKSVVISLIVILDCLANI